MIRAEKRLYTLDDVSTCERQFELLTYIKAGVYLISLRSSRFSTIDVIIPAAWNAIVLDGYAMSRLLGRPDDVAGGMCARCSKQSVVLVLD